ncbi:AMP-binding protein [Amycolatopsis aidingensis]|uniref:AMP-binding protein n=1 Tax=Amycolatopsis aidingensis TaxID=2842453 RepID=UPI001C0B28C2|nr:AMP-binding protein [Amycolatopsis aidingensis]
MASAFLSRLLAALEDYGGRTAFRHRGGSLSYRAAGEILRGLAAGFGAECADAPVAVMGGNRPETVLAQLAAQLRGLPVLLVAASASLPDRAAALHTAGVRTLVVDPRREQTRALAEAARPERLLSIGPWPGAHDLLADPSHWPDPDLADLPDAVRTIFPSGGTTGPPKLIEHSGIYDGMAHIFRPDPAGPGRVLVVAPVSHLTGNAAVLGALLRGDTVVLHEGFDAGAVLRDIAAERVTELSLTPPRLAALLDHPARPGTDLSSVRSLSLGASPLPAHRLRQALAVFGPVVGQGYGLTEAPMIASISAAELAGHPGRLESVGRIVPGMEARIDDDGDGTGIGEVLVRGLALMAGYRGRQGANAAVVVDGWLRTGDIGRFDAEGYLYLLGRADDVIVTGEHGTRVHPTMVENALTGCRGVREVAVVGVPGPEGTVLRAVVVPTEPDAVRAEDVRGYARATLGQEHFVPAEVMFTPALPLTEIGKPDRKALS